MFSKLFHSPIPLWYAEEQPRLYWWKDIIRNIRHQPVHYVRVGRLQCRYVFDILHNMRSLSQPSAIGSGLGVVPLHFFAQYNVYIHSLIRANLLRIDQTWTPLPFKQWMFYEYQITICSLHSTLSSSSGVWLFVLGVGKYSLCSPNAIPFQRHSDSCRFMLFSCRSEILDERT